MLRFLLETWPAHLPLADFLKGAGGTKAWGVSLTKFITSLQRLLGSASQEADFFREGCVEGKYWKAGEAKYDLYMSKEGDRLGKDETQTDYTLYE